jgi:site-specific DNA-methyltransferase (adenine-specific)
MKLLARADALSLPLAADSVSAIVTDPPYGLAFMGKAWDTLAANNRTSQFWHQRWAVEALRVLKPGGHVLAFGGTRTYHRLVCALEDAGFEIRDTLAWLHGSGFPKSLDVSKAIDKAAGAERETLGVNPNGGRHGPSKFFVTDGSEVHDTAPATEAAKAWDGWGTALKPAHEPIVLARKPLSEKTVAANVLRWGTGALNVDGCRVDSDGETWPGNRDNAHGDYSGKVLGKFAEQYAKPSHPSGRWPANVLLDEEAAAQLDAQSGESTSPEFVSSGESGKRGTCGAKAAHPRRPCHGDTGGASRFFYVAKASTSERGEGNTHPTVKPVALMKHLIRLVAPPGGVVLDPFLGSGTTGRAARALGVPFVGFDLSAEYVALAAKRANGVQREFA